MVGGEGREERKVTDQEGSRGGVESFVVLSRIIKENI